MRGRPAQGAALLVAGKTSIETLQVEVSLCEFMLSMCWMCLQAHELLACCSCGCERLMIRENVSEHGLGSWRFTGFSNGLPSCKPCGQLFLASNPYLLPPQCLGPG